MNKMVQISESSIIFKIRQDMELLLLASNLALFDDLNEAVGKKEFVADGQVMDMFRDMHRNASKYMLQELDAFFGNITFQLAFFTYSLDRGKVGYIFELLDKLENDDVKELLSYMVQAFVQTCLTGKNKEYDSSKVCSSIEEMRLYVMSEVVEDESVRSALVEFLQNPNETKQRYCFLLRSFYEKIYKPYERTICDYLERAKTKYENIFRKDPYGFFNTYLNISPDKFQKKLEIHVSCFHQTSILVIQLNDIRKPTWVGLGGNSELNLQYKSSMLYENQQKLFKILSDKTRFVMLSLLKERPWYNQEMSEKLGIAQSTINHHFCAMMDVEIVTMERDAHRMYYSLKKDKLKELLDKAYEIFGLN